MLSRNYLTKFFFFFLVIPPGVPSTVCNPTTTQGNYVTTRAGLDLPHLQVALQEYFANGAARSTWRTYAVGQRRYLSFCAAARRQAVPTTETSLMLFATHLATSGLAYTSIKVYLAAVRHLHVTKGKHSQFTAQLTPRLQQVLKGIKKAQAVSRQPAIRRPITPTILKGIRATLLSQPRCFSNIMTWAACCLAFFGFLRSSEFTVPSQYEYDGSVHLSVQDITIDSRSAPRMIRVRIKQSKTDSFRQGVDIYLGRTDTDICPVKAILPYLAIRGNRPGPLFIQEDGKMLTRQMFSSIVKGILARLPLSEGNYNTHSFRIGAATAAMEAQIPEAHIKMLGRWRSDAYQLYIRTPAEELAKLSRKLVSGATPLRTRQIAAQQSY